ncbi:M20/M25/M40 family metallo-hydrolase [Streptomyces xanthophaeus]|uniref:M20/M25/M40 family metallo-hydrolase n=1 Tax=Streptomyces xanthophaeus TaxID=67385 RepID=UPI00371B24CE
MAALADWVGIESARWLADTMSRTGFPRVEVWETHGLPAVSGCWPAPEGEAPVLLVYSHHDVHVAEPAEWQVTAPFAPLLRDGRLYGRGASDAKGQVMCHLWALGAHMRGRSAPAVTVKYLIEGEEETGSLHMADLLSAHADDLEADVVMVSDSMLWSLDDPTVSVPFDLPTWLADTGTFEDAGEAGFTVPERLWARPSVEVARLTAGRSDAPAPGLIPAKASADLLFRLVPDQRADQVAEQLRAWLDERRRPGFAYALDVPPTISDPYRTPPGQAARARALLRDRTAR